MFGISPPGSRDMENGTIEVARRDTLEKSVRNREGLADYLADLLDEIQTSIYRKAKLFQEEKTTEVKDWDEFKDILENKGGFISAYWDGTPETEEKIKAETKATIRCRPLDSEKDTVVPQELRTLK